MLFRSVAITLVEHRDRAKIRNIERFTQQDIVASVIAGLEPQAKPNFGGGGRSNGRPGNRSGGGRYGSGSRSESRFGGGNNFGGGNKNGGAKRSDDSRPSRSADSRPKRPAGPRFAKPKSGGQRRSFSGN